MREPDPSAPTPRSRRLSRRRPPRSRVRVSCRVGGLGLGPDLALSVLDLSETGVRLVVRQALEAGREVSVGLEGESSPRPVARVGRVMWSIPAAAGHCVGVAFDRRLPHKDFLQLTVEPTAREQPAEPSGPPAVGATERPVGGLDGSERAAAQRHAPNPARRCRVSPPGGRPDLDATLLDVSEAGAGLAASGPLSAGEAVVLRFEGGGPTPQSLPARVVYGVELKAGWFLVGARFDRLLRADQLSPLVARMAPLATGELLDLTGGPAATV